MCIYFIQFHSCYVYLYIVSPLGCFHIEVALLLFCIFLFTKSTLRYTEKIPLPALTALDIAVHILHAYGYAWTERLIGGKQKK